MVLQCIAPFVQGLQPNICLSYLLDVQHQIGAVITPSLSFLSDNFTTLVVRVLHQYDIQFCHPCPCNAGSCPILCQLHPECLRKTPVGIRMQGTISSHAIILLTGTGRALPIEEDDDAARVNVRALLMDRVKLC